MATGKSVKINTNLQYTANIGIANPNKVVESFACFTAGRDLPAFPVGLVDSGGSDSPPQLSSALWESLSLLYSGARKDSTPKAQCECQ